jgi:AhpD family alkylhydroperoxidase
MMECLPSGQLQALKILSAPRPSKKKFKVLSRFLPLFCFTPEHHLLKHKKETMTQRISYQDATKGLWDGLIKTDMYLKRSGLDHKLLELVKYRVSQINGCAFCLDMHHKEATHLGETELRLHSLAAWREAPYYSDAERAALAFAEALTFANQQDVSDTLYNELSNCFSKAAIADLTVAIAQINSWNRINKAFRTIPGQYKVGQFN